MTECPYCKIKMKETTMPMTFKFSPNVIVQEVNIHECPKCSFQSISEEETERVRKLVNKVKETAKIAQTVIIK
jgi:C4-type Zn-finger protein